MINLYRLRINKMTVLNEAFREAQKHALEYLEKIPEDRKQKERQGLIGLYTDIFIKSAKERKDYE
jgi:hypothetical protein